MIRIPQRCIALAVPATLCAALQSVPLPARAALYRCDDAQGATYTDRPCVSGQQRLIPPAAPVSAADRANAERQARADRAALEALEARQARERTAAQLAAQRASQLDAQRAAAQARADQQRALQCQRQRIAIQRANATHLHASRSSGAAPRVIAVPSRDPACGNPDAGSPAAPRASD